ncbi:putative toxin-antitoxin system toxin component, PIN family [Candidatus Bathyarchaeota archaeon]|nr:putative toxin-antitoxin system toxin component, PIN family [Candidatus Bathyarchaeota archaeon]
MDTNVLISALVGHGKPRRLVTLLLERHQIVTSRQMLAEFADVASREEFAEVGRTRVVSFMSILARHAVIVPVKHVLNVIVEDPDDNIVLSTALQGNASQIVSGDRHLLELRRYRGVRIVTVEEMLAEIFHLLGERAEKKS